MVNGLTRPLHHGGEDEKNKSTHGIVCTATAVVHGEYVFEIAWR